MIFFSKNRKNWQTICTPQKTIKRQHSLHLVFLRFTIFLSILCYILKCSLKYHNILIIIYKICFLYHTFSYINKCELLFLALFPITLEALNWSLLLVFVIIFLSLISAFVTVFLSFIHFSYTENRVFLNEFR